jgi:hypothetical protein
MDDLAGRPDTWENPTLARYLDAMAARAATLPDGEGWDLVRTLMLAARDFE